MNEFGEYWARSPHLLYVLRYRYQDIKTENLEIPKSYWVLDFLDFLNILFLEKRFAGCILKYKVYIDDLSGVTIDYEEFIGYILPITVLLINIHVFLEL